jgi:hypothetical protein
MPSSGMLGRVDLVRTDVSEKLIAAIIKVTRISELGTELAITRNRSTQLCFQFADSCYHERASETSVFTRTTQLNIPEDGIHHSRVIDGG